MFVDGIGDRPENRMCMPLVDERGGKRQRNPNARTSLKLNSHNPHPGGKLAPTLAAALDHPITSPTLSTRL